MGLSTSVFPCGCRQSRLLDPIENIWVVWKRCAEHYDPAVDDAKIIEAEKNYRAYMESLCES